MILWEFQRPSTAAQKPVLRPPVGPSTAQVPLQLCVGQVLVYKRGFSYEKLLTIPSVFLQVSELHGINYSKTLPTQPP